MSQSLLKIKAKVQKIMRHVETLEKTLTFWSLLTHTMKEKYKVTLFRSHGFLDYKSPIVDASPIKNGVI